MNAHKLLWNYPEKYKNVTIHLSDKLISELEGRICSTGILNGVIVGSRYNRCWPVHGILVASLGLKDSQLIIRQYHF